MAIPCSGSNSDPAVLGAICISILNIFMINLTLNVGRRKFNRLLLDFCSLWLVNWGVRGGQRAWQGPVLVFVGL